MCVYILFRISISSSITLTDCIVRISFSSLLFILPRSQPINTFSWGADTINTVRFNQTEKNVLAGCGNDRSIILYDLRTGSPLAKMLMEVSYMSVYSHLLQSIFLSNVVINS